MFQNISKCFKIFQNVSKYFTMFQNIIFLKYCFNKNIL
ncbi:hypothetical protein, partial [Plasmodium yoelii yoelii]